MERQGDPVGRAPICVSSDQSSILSYTTLANKGLTGDIYAPSVRIRRQTQDVARPSRVQALKLSAIGLTHQSKQTNI